MRVFIAVDLPQKIRTDLAKATDVLRQSGVRASWVKQENLHITMKFLGDVEEELLPEIKDWLDQVGAESQRFQTCLRDHGFFPPQGRPRILYVATDQTDRFSQIVKGIDSRLVCAGFERERKFTSHITLARIKVPDKLEKLRAALRTLKFSGRFEVNGLSLYRSVLMPSGARYESLHFSPFQSRLPRK